MQVHPSQLIPGCILLNDVMGKTSSPIVHQDTVLSETHITFLENFLIPAVDVSDTITDGTPFHPKEGVKNEPIAHAERSEQNAMKPLESLYLQAVQDFTTMFRSWQQHTEIDMLQVRTSILPLFERVTDFGSDIFTLHRYATKETYMFHHGVSVGMLSMYLNTHR